MNTEREYQIDSKPADPISFVNKMPAAVIEVKHAEKGRRLLQVEEQINFITWLKDDSLSYLENLPEPECIS